MRYSNSLRLLCSVFIYSATAGAGLLAGSLSISVLFIALRSFFYQ